jgi:hypothetical protein
MKQIRLVGLLCVILLFSSCTNSPSPWKDLFNGQNLDNWKKVRQGASFRVEDGNLVCSGNGGFILSEQAANTKNFELTAEVQTAPGSVAVLLFHTSESHNPDAPAGYQVVLGNTQVKSADRLSALKSGSLLGVRHNYFPMVSDGQWFTLSVRVVENHVETSINGVKVLDYVQPGNPWRTGSNSKRILSKGRFGIETLSGETWLKSFRIRTLPEGEKMELPVDPGWDTQVTKMAEQFFPLIDFHVHLKGGLTIDQSIENSQKLGINYGIAPNCGLKFPVTDDISLAAYMDTVRGKPIFRGMQAEGREWITLFSPEAIAKFDYVFTDALTFTDYKGRRTRMWMPQEVWVDEKQQFMDQLVGKIEAIMSQEPVNIYVNPTLLPAALMPEYDQLWTPERVARVIKVLKDNNIVLEINARYKVPHPQIILEGKKAGLTFSFGTNNAAADLGQLEYCLEMIEECGLTPEDMFLPPVHKEKPVLVKGLPAKITG